MKELDKIWAFVDGMLSDAALWHEYVRDEKSPPKRLQCYGYGASKADDSSTSAPSLNATTSRRFLTSIKALKKGAGLAV